MKKIQDTINYTAICLDIRVRTPASARDEAEARNCSPAFDRNNGREMGRLQD